ncbi:MAG TPA: ParB/RepB/Spo0J family partition protein [Candidatus Dojkabacteria bacterium]|nr:ParB/RepB/Spo0J family partition protein [Candidatus Dojkabacteria bacterium]
MDEKKRLGKGLAALISSKEMDNSSSSYVKDFPISKIEVNPYQPRMKIDPEQLISIADSIRTHGVIQPLIITKQDGVDRYTLIAGERRLKAAQLAGLKSVPVVIKDTSPQEMLEIALIENIQRKDLNPLEEAYAFRQMQEEFGLSHQEIAKRVGVSRVSVTNKMRILQIPDPIKEEIMNERLSEGHARALMGIKDDTSMIAAADIVIRRHMSVRETEAFVRKITYGKTASRKNWAESDPRTKAYEQLLSQKLGYSAHIRKMTKGGRIIIRYNTVDELADLMKKLI